MKLIIVRHGQTEENIGYIMQGQTHGTLSKLGREQVKKAGERLADERIDVAYASDLRRVTDTLDAILAHHPGVPVEHTALLRERSMGTFEGKHVDVLRAARKGEDGNRVEWRPPRGENFHDVHARAKQFLQMALEKHRGQNVLVVSHGGLLRMMLSVLIGMDKREALNPEYAFQNASVSIFECTKLGHASAVCLSDTAHLE